MKNLITAFITILSFSVAYASNSPEVLVSNDMVEVKAVNDGDINLSVIFNDSSEDLEFKAETTIAAIQIYNELGEMEYILPVLANKVNINKSLLNEGNSKIGFQMVGQNSTYFTQITIR